MSTCILKLFSISPIGILLPMKEVLWHCIPPVFDLPIAEIAGIGKFDENEIPRMPKIKFARFTRIRKMESGETMYILTDEN